MDRSMPKALWQYEEEYLAEVCVCEREWETSALLWTTSEGDGWGKVSCSDWHLGSVRSNPGKDEEGRALNLEETVYKKI